MTLQIGTILIAKESFGDYTKGKGYSILENDRDINYKVSSDNSTIINWFSDKAIETNFTIKRYTLQDLKEKKIAVKLTKKDDFYKICDLLGYTPNSGDYSFTEYHAVDEDNEFVWCNFDWLKDNNYTLVPSIDLIDLEAKEEVKETSFTWQVMESDLANAKEEIARLKGENEELKKKINLVELTEESTANKYSSSLTEIAQLKRTIKQLEGTFIQDLRESTPDLEKRERMAWELFVKAAEISKGKHIELTIDDCFEYVDELLKKSKEVKP